MASVITQYDTNLPGGTGFYNGTGNADGNFTNTVADYSGGGTITGSLRLTQRTVGAISPSVDDNYNCALSEQCNIDYSVYTDGGLHLNDFTYQLIITDITQGTSLSFDPLNTIPDDSYWTANSGGSKTSVKNTATEVGFQNSEYLGFSFIQTPLHWTSTDQLLVTLSFNPVSGSNPDPQVNMTVNASSAVPEPATFGLMGFALVGIGLLRKRKMMKM